MLHDALLRDERARNEAERDPAMRALGLPYPTNLGIVPAASGRPRCPTG